MFVFFRNLYRSFHNFGICHCQLFRSFIVMRIVQTMRSLINAKTMQVTLHDKLNSSKVLKIKGKYIFSKYGSLIFGVQSIFFSFFTSNLLF